MKHFLLQSPYKQVLMSFLACRMFSILVVLICGYSLLPAQNLTPSTTALVCACGTSANILLTSTQAEARRGIPSFIVLRGQRFGGSFGEAVGGMQNMDIRGFPNAYGATTFGGGITVQTAVNYGAIIGPFKAGVPTVATIVAEMVDVFGDVVTTASTTTASLEVGNLVPEWRKQWLSTNNTVTTSTNGRFEWSDVEIEGLAGTTLTLRVRHSTLATCSCAVQIALQGGFPYTATFATQNANASESPKLYPGAPGPFAVPGVVGEGKYSGSLREITVGGAITFPYADAAGQSYNSTAVIITDRYGNYASFSTEATMRLVGGNPPVNELKTPLIGNVANSVITWGLGQMGREVRGVPSTAQPGIARTVADLNQTALGTMIPLTQSPFSTGDALTNNAANVSPALGASGVGYPPANNPQIFQNVATFPGLQVWGATSSNVELQVLVRPSKETWIGSNAVVATSAIVDLLPGGALGIMPVIIPDKYDSNRLKRMSSRFVIGQSNAADPATWFYIQVIDEFGNRVDRGPNTYNGGTANITFYAPEQGLPRAAGATANAEFPPNGFQFTNANDPHVKANNQRYSALGTSAIAVNGLYTFNNFTPLGPPSIDAVGNDVVLTFEDTNLKGRYRCRCTGTARPAFLEHSPVTTATTTFLAPTSVQLSDAGRGEAVSIAPNPTTHSAEHVTVRYRLEEAARVRCEVVSMQGVVATRFDAGFQARGEQVFMLPLGDVQSGVYVVRVLAGSRVQAVMLTVVR